MDEPHFLWYDKHIKHLEDVMSKGANQKLKLIYLMKILMEKTDDTHSITMAEILSSLESYGITASVRVFIVILSV